MTEQDDVLASLCAELPALRAGVRASPARRMLLDRAVDAARRGEPFIEPLRRMGIALGEPDEAASPQRSPSSPPWKPGPPRPLGGLYVCPVGVCPRWSDRQPSGPLPLCHLHDRPLQFVPDP
jgi:hypothetical protein